MPRRRRPEDEFLPTFIIITLLCAIPLGSYAAYAVSKGPTAALTERDKATLGQKTDDLRKTSDELIERQLEALGIFDKENQPVQLGEATISPSFGWPREGKIEVLRKTFRGTSSEESVEVLPRMSFALALTPDGDGLLVTPTELRLMMPDGGIVNVSEPDLPVMIGSGEFFPPFRVGKDGTLEEIPGLDELTTSARAGLEERMLATIEDQEDARRVLDSLRKGLDEDTIATRTGAFWDALVGPYHGRFERGVTKTSELRRPLLLTIDSRQFLDSEVSLTYEGGVPCAPDDATICAEFTRAMAYDPVQVREASEQFVRLTLLSLPASRDDDMSIVDVSLNDEERLVSDPKTMMPRHLVIRRDMSSLLQVRLEPEQPTRTQMSKLHMRSEYTFTYNLSSR